MAAAHNGFPARIGRWFSNAENKKAFFSFAFFGLFLVSLAYSFPITRYGDSCEYVLATESIALDGTIEFSPAQLVRHALIKPPETDCPSGAAVVTGLDGKRYWGIHSLYYSLIAAPFFLLFSYQGYYVLNALFLVLTAAMIYGHLRRHNQASTALVLAFAFVFFSAAFTYFFWIHTETIGLFLATAFVYFATGKKYLLSSAFLGLLVAIRPPAAIFFIYVAYLVYRDSRKLNELLPRLASNGAAMAATAAPQFLMNLAIFGSINPLLGSGLASLSFINPGELVLGLVDPATGLLWFYPLVLLALLNYRRIDDTVILAFCSLAFLAAFLSNIAYYTHQVGWRYLNVIYPLLIFASGSIDLSKSKNLLLLGFAILATSSLIIAPIDNSESMSVDVRPFLPAKVFSALGYTYDPVVFKMSSLELSPSVMATNYYADGWFGPGSAKILVAQEIPDNELVLEVSPIISPMEVTLSSYSHSEQYGLESTAFQNLSFRFADADRASNRRWGDLFKTYYVIRLTPSDYSVPAASGLLPYYEFNSSNKTVMFMMRTDVDSRKLAVRVRAIYAGGKPIFRNKYLINIHE